MLLKTEVNKEALLWQMTIIHLLMLEIRGGLRLVNNSYRMFGLPTKMKVETKSKSDTSRCEFDVNNVPMEEMSND